MIVNQEVKKARTRDKYQVELEGWIVALRMALIKDCQKIDLPQDPESPIGKEARSLSEALLMGS